MKIYRAKGDGKFDIEVVDPTEASAEPGKVKVRVTHVLPDATDAAVFFGDPQTAYPIVPGHCAIGVVSDDRPEYGLKRGTKVILDPYVCDGIDQIDKESCLCVRGVDVDGFMREFAYADISGILPFPGEDLDVAQLSYDGEAKSSFVDEREAVFAEKIALALKCLNSLKAEKGEYALIVGGGCVCNIVAQLALYFQLVPIVADTNESNLRRMERCGVYYAINMMRDSLIDKVTEITCGRMAENSILALNAVGAPESTFNVTKIGGKCVFLSENRISRAFETDIAPICRRRLCATGINNGASEMSSAVNILAQRILRFDGFIDREAGMRDAEMLLREMKSDPERYFGVLLTL